MYATASVCTCSCEACVWGRGQQTGLRRARATAHPREAERMTELGQSSTPTSALGRTDVSVSPLSCLSPRGTLASPPRTPTTSW